MRNRNLEFRGQAQSQLRVNNFITADIALSTQHSALSFFKSQFFQWFEKKKCLSGYGYKKRLLIFCCCLLLFGCQSTKQTQGTIVKIERVVSGQTLEWVDTSKQPALIDRVRLIGIEAPDLRQQPWGDQAKQQLEQMTGKINGQKLVFESVLLESDVEQVDQFGRKLAYVWKDGVLLNEQLVKEGSVLAVVRSPNHKYDQRLIRAQEYARLMGKGIWNPEQPMRLTPAEFKSQNK